MTQPLTFKPETVSGRQDGLQKANMVYLKLLALVFVGISSWWAAIHFSNRVSAQETPDVDALVEAASLGDTSTVIELLEGLTPVQVESVGIKVFETIADEYATVAVFSIMEAALEVGKEEAATYAASVMRAVIAQSASVLEQKEKEAARKIEQKASEIDKFLERNEKIIREVMARLEDSNRMIMRNIGHNVLILHEDQSPATLSMAGHPDTYMPEEYARRLGESGLETLNHLLPVLQQPIHWPEYGIYIILSGTPGQMPVSHRRGFLNSDGTEYTNPIFYPIPEGKLRLGNSVARELNLAPGDTVHLMGEEFEIDDVRMYQGSQEDIMVWCTLEKAQQWLDREGKINAVLALVCICEGDIIIGSVEEDIAGVLSDVQVLEYDTRLRAGALAMHAIQNAKREVLFSIMETRLEIIDALRDDDSLKK